MAKLTEKSIQDIIDKRQRMSAPDRDASWRMSSLLQTFNNPLKHRDELVRYFPIAVVATIDGYFRARLASLIDSGEPFLSNAIVAYPNVTLDTQLAVAIAAKKVSLGELLTNSFNISSFESLIQIVSRVTGSRDFLKQLEEIKPSHLDTKERDRVIRDPKTTWGQLGRVFELRHILCHELAADLEIDDSDTRTLLITAQQFMSASAAWFEKLENPNPPLSREQRLRRARESLSSAERQLENQIERFGSSPIQIRGAVRDLKAKFEAFHRSVDTAMTTASRFPPLLSMFEEQNLINQAEAARKLSTQLRWLYELGGPKVGEI